MHPTYEALTDPDELLAGFGVCAPAGSPAEGWAPCILRPDGAAAPEARFGLQGLLPNFAPGTHFARHTANCPVETMKSTPAFRESWWAGRRCVIPVRWIAVWRYAAGRPERWHVEGADATALALAGLWNAWQGPTGETVMSFTTLTLAARGHEVFDGQGTRDDDARMPAVLLPDTQPLWLGGSLQDAERLLRPCPPRHLRATAQAPSDQAWREPSSWAAVPDMFALEWHAQALAQPRRRAARGPRSLAVPGTHMPGPTTAELF